MTRYKCKLNEKGYLHGEYILWRNDEIIDHAVYIHGERYHTPINELTNDDKIFLAIKHSIFL